MDASTVVAATEICANVNWGMIVAIIGVNIGLVAVVVAFILWAFSKLDGDIRSLSSDIKASNARTDQLYQIFTVHAEQTRQMFYDLLKAQTPKTNP